MNAVCGCSREKQRRAVKNGAGWIIPGVILLLMPKCPLCLAAAISLLFGIGLFKGATSVVHTTVIVLCTSAIFIFAARQLIPLFQRHAMTSKDGARRSSN